MRSSTPLRIFIPALLAAVTVTASVANSKPRSIEPLDAVFQTSAPGTIEASLDPPIRGVLRIVVRANSPAQSKSNSFAGEDADQVFTLEVTQSDRPIPYRLVSQSGRHRSAAGGLVADIDVNDLTPGLPVRVRVHSILQDPPALDGRAYAVVY